MSETVDQRCPRCGGLCLPQLETDTQDRLVSLSVPLVCQQCGRPQHLALDPRQHGPTPNLPTHTEPSQRKQRPQ